MDWSRIFARRQEIHRQYPAIWSLKRVKKRHQIIAQATAKSDPLLLDVGASQRALHARLQKIFPQLSYQSMDVDRSTEQDYYDLKDVPDNHFEVVTLMEVIEHVRPEEAYAMLEQIFRVLKPGGALVLTTPNIFHPSQYFRDVTHVTPWAFDELAGFCVDVGFKVERLVRIHNEVLLKWWCRCLFFWPFHRMMGIDYARTIMILARKN